MLQGKCSRIEGLNHWWALDRVHWCTNGSLRDDLQNHGNAMISYFLVFFPSFWYIKTIISMRKWRTSNPSERTSSLIKSLQSGLLSSQLICLSITDQFSLRVCLDEGLEQGIGISCLNETSRPLMSLNHYEHGQCCFFFLSNMGNAFFIYFRTWAML